jgi:enoyl-[acyl-carrier-protein] reductase (NADH)
LAEADAPPAGKAVEDYLRDFTAANSALGRMPTGGEVGATCHFLTSPAASAITGQCINVDCGVLPQ